MNIDFFKPKFPKFHLIKNFFAAIYKRCIFSNNGPVVQGLEKRMRDLFDYNGEIVTCANGTIALMIAFKAIGAKKALVPSFTFPATMQALEWCGIDYEYVDIDEKTWTIDIAKLEEAILKYKPDMIVPVHSFGAPCDVKSIERLSAIHGVKVVYDAAPAISSFVKVGDKNIHIANFGEISCFSLHATKVMPSGEGGVIFVKDKDLGDKIRAMCNFGFTDLTREPKVAFGMNGKLSEIHAAFGAASLDQLAINQMDRMEIVNKYKDRLKGIVEFQEIADGDVSSHQVFNICLKKEDIKLRDKLIQEMEDIYGIQCRKYYNPPMHKTLLYARDVDLPGTENICDRVITLPAHLWLDSSESDYVIKSFIELYETWKER